MGGFDGAAVNPAGKVVQLLSRLLAKAFLKVTERERLNRKAMATD